ncbi:DUF4440 domain-containing protein [Cryptosporangium aurantiacum]|uniref:DUF4440 domain-containing protein n=1 Tax=Cryptosporangium aurantiacum TaxID=134849 RepID=A0A1M7RKF5_9ACTN|nr:DUF4440 domain-containing protein [Cryptosporangium aurantiacum]SHN46639.1 hypothetical protein SAMN05443668_11722 [Cryptosporangium aurantiacum]
MSRPTLSDPAALRAAEEAVERFADELQAAGEAFDADLYDRSFADDVLWGSPYGATLAGFASLNRIHHSLMDAARDAADPDAPSRGAPPSKFEVVSVLAPAPGVAVAQIRRQATAEGAFSEMALYVLVEREGRWWLAAAQNTPIR